MKTYDVYVEEIYSVDDCASYDASLYLVDTKTGESNEVILSLVTNHPFPEQLARPNDWNMRASGEDLDVGLVENLIEQFKNHLDRYGFIDRYNRDYVPFAVGI